MRSGQLMVARKVARKAKSEALATPVEAQTREPLAAAPAARACAAALGCLRAGRQADGAVGGGRPAGGCSATLGWGANCGTCGSPRVNAPNSATSIGVPSRAIKAGNASDWPPL